VRSRDLALIAFKVVALWIVVSGVIQASELVLNWLGFQGQFAGGNWGPSAPSPQGMMWYALTALLARSLVGVLIWVLSRRLACSLFPVDDPAYTTEGALVLYRGASFLVGLYLLADSIPAAFFMLTLAIRGGWRPQEAEGVAQLVSLWVKLGLGTALLRGGDWVRELILPQPKPVPADTSEK
jgi:hypothetical protein